MTVHTIPADHLDAARGGVLVVDGECPIQCGGEWPNHKMICSAAGWAAPAEFVKLTERCETCDGSGHATFGNQVRTSEKCPDCDGSGRPWLTIHVDFKPGVQRRTNLSVEPSLSFRAHVLNVVPIVGARDEPPDRGQYVRQYPHDPQICGGDNWPRSITLPPGDHVGRYAVLIDKRKNPS